MAKYIYEARAANGQNMRGEIDAINEVDARNKLRAQRVVPLKLVPKQASMKDWQVHRNHHDRNDSAKNNHKYRLNDRS